MQSFALNHFTRAFSHSKAYLKVIMRARTLWYIAGWSWKITKWVMSLTRAEKWGWKLKVLLVNRACELLNLFQSQHFHAGLMELFKHEELRVEDTQLLGFNYSRNVLLLSWILYFLKFLISLIKIFLVNLRPWAARRDGKVFYLFSRNLSQLVWSSNLLGIIYWLFHPFKHLFHVFFCV